MEFVLVGALLTVLTLAVLQFALAVYARNVVHDAAVEGAYRAALADTSDTEGAARTREIIARTLGEGFVGSVTVSESVSLGHPVIELTVVSPLPLLGLWGVPDAVEVTARAPAETLD